MGQSREQKGNQEWNNPESKGVIKNGQSREQRGNQEWTIQRAKG